MFDPGLFLRKKSLYLYALRRHAYVERSNLWMPEIGLGLTLWRGSYEGSEAEWLRWCYEDSTLVPTGAERLAAKLRALGVDSDGL